MAFGKFLVGVAKGMDLDPMVDMYAKAHRRREDRKEKIEDRDYADLRSARNLGAQHGVTDLGPDATSQDYVDAVGEIRSPAGQFATAATLAGKSVPQYRKDLGVAAELDRQKQKFETEKLGPNYVDPAVTEARRAKQKEDERKRKAAARAFGMDITNDRGQIDPLLEEEFLAEVAKDRQLKNAVLEWKMAGMDQMEINNRKTFIQDEIPIYKRELDFYAQSANSPEGVVAGKSIPKMDAIRASIKRMEAGNSAEKIAAIRSDMTRLREILTVDAGRDGGIYGQFKKSEGERAQDEEETALKQERGESEESEGEARLKEWRKNDKGQDWLGGERPKASAGPLTPGQSPIAPGTSPLLVNPDAAATPPPEEIPITTPLPEAGAQDPATTATLPDTVGTLPDTVGTTPAPGERPVDPKAKAKEQEVMGQIQREQDATQPPPDNIIFTPEELQARYADTDLSIQERYYNPGSLRLTSVEEGHGFGWKGLVGTGDRNFAQFDSPKAGMDALKQQLRVDQAKTKKDGSPLTVSEFVRQYVGGINPDNPKGKGSDPEGTKRALINIPKLLGLGLDTHIKDIEHQALLKAVMTNENHSADSLSVFQRYMEDTPLDPSTQTPGVNPIMEGTGGLGDRAVDIKKMDEGALIEALAPKTGQPELDWDTLSPEDKAWIQKNRPNIYNVIAGN